MGVSETGAGMGFSPDERELVKDLVFDGREIPPAELSGWLDAKCPARLREEVERLLRAARSVSETFLAQSAPNGILGISRALPQRIGRYPILGVLGTGGMGMVYLAEDEGLKRRVAVKVLRARTADNAEMQERLRWDARTLASLQHPNIVTVHEVGSDGDADFVVMEFVSGVTLNEVIPRNGMKPADVLGFALQIASGLEAAHSAGIVHRDVKPGNIMVTESGLVKLVDFGLAKDIWATPGDGPTPPTVQGRFAGTPNYVSPEQADGKQVDVRSDIFSFGSVLYEMATGRRAFPGETFGTVITCILRDEPPSLMETKPELDPRLNEIVERCLRKDRTRRFQSIGEVRLRLQEFKEEVEHPKPPTPEPEPEPRGFWIRMLEVVRRPEAWTLGVVLLGIGAAAALILGLVQGRGRNESVEGTVLTRLTTDSGFSETPALSTDGKMLAYASDRDGPGNLDIWVKSLPDGDPYQITHGPDNNYEPVFSPDGTKIAYRSDRGGGIYLIPASGGSPVPVALKGRGPQFSPDGQSLAYYTGEVGLSMLPGSTQIWIVSTRPGSVPTKFREDFQSSAYPVWAPRGDRLLFLGRGPNEKKGDWWVASLDGKYAYQTPLLSRISKAQLHKPLESNWFRPVAWLENGRVLFSAKQGDATNIWSMEMNANGITSGVPQKLTSGTGIDRHPSARESGGHFDMAFEVETATMDVWRVPLNANGVNEGSPDRLLFGMGAISSPSISSDGSRMAFATRLSNGLAIRIYDPVTRTTDTAHTLRSFDTSRPVLSGNGQTIAYSDVTKGYLTHIAGGETEVFCEPCSPPTHISADGREVLAEAADEEDQIQICSGPGHCRPLIPWAGKKVLKQSGARFSPNGRWVVFCGSRFDSPGRHIWITPVRESGPVVESDLIQLTDGPAADLEPFWSPDGRTIFFLSDRDGSRCVYGRHVNPETAQPTDLVFPVFHAHKASWTIGSPTGHPADIGLSATRDSLILMMTKRQGNVWLRADPARTR